MKLSCHLLLLLTLPVVGLETVLGDSGPTAKPLPVRSVFAPPSSPNEGRDPFFPESARPFESLPNAKRAAEAIVLKSPGFSVVNGTRMAIVNNHTFSIGDAGYVMANGKRVQIRCLEIHTNKVIILLNGQKQEVRFGGK